MTTEEAVLLQISLPRNVLNIIDHLKLDWQMNRSEVIEKILRKGLEKMLADAGEDAELLSTYLRQL